MKKDITCFFFVPGLSNKYLTGGLLVIQDIAKLLKDKGISVEFVATHEKHPSAISPEKAFKNYKLQTTNYKLFIVTWGPLVEDHIKLIRKNVPDAKILYYAQSFGWGIKIPKEIPIVCVSKFVMRKWQAENKENVCSYIPPPLNPHFHLRNSAREFDILVHTRKQNDYCLKKLLPALQTTHYKLQTINEWISQEKFAELLNRTKVFLYLTSSHKAGWFRRLPAEGFGLPALEAVACGAIVGSNLLGGVTDFLVPGENCIKLQEKSLEFDLEQIKNAVEKFQVNENRVRQTIAPYKPEAVGERWWELINFKTQVSITNKNPKYQCPTLKNDK